MGNDIDLVNTSEDNNKNENNKDNSNNNDNPIFCPICNQNLTGFSNIVIQSHVNRCLDGPSLIQKRSSFSNKIQSSITSYMNISTQTQSRITSFVNVDKPLEDNTESKYFGNSNNKRKLTKSKSCNESFNTVKKNSNKKSLIKTNSYNDSINNSLNDNIGVNNNNNIESIKVNIDNNLEMKSTSAIFENKNKINIEMKSNTENNNEILFNFTSSIEIKDSSINNSSSNIDNNKHMEDNNYVINKRTEVNSDSNIPFALEDMDEDDVYSNNFYDIIENNIFDNIVNNEKLDDIINQNDFYDTKNSIRDEIKKQDGEIFMNDSNLNENDMNNMNNSNSSYKSNETKKRKRTNKEKNNKKTTTKVLRKRKMCPSFKRVQNTSFVVDAFSYGKIDNCTAYFLSHFHTDHYGGITSKFDYGPIYCSKVTSNLLIELLKVDKQYVHPLELNREYIIDGVKVTLIDANHCPGAVLFLFNIPIGNNNYFNALHTGDFRANINQLMHPAIQSLKNSYLDILYLDTTYLGPEHLFPSQEIVINSVLDVLKYIIFEGKTVKEYNHLDKKKKLDNEYKGGLLRYFNNGGNDSIIAKYNDESISEPIKKGESSIRKRVLVLVGTYMIGKEKVFVAIAKYLKSKIYAGSKKMKILECLNDETISMLLTSDPDEASVHVLNMGQLSIDNVNDYYNKYKDKYDMIIAFRPTGWVFKPKKANKKQLQPDGKNIQEELNKLKLKPSYYNKNISIWGIPYSEHSSFLELENFIRVISSIAPIRNIQPTVNVGSFSKKNEESKKYWYWFDTWRNNPLII